LYEIQTKVLRVFLLLIIALRFLFLQIHATSYSFFSVLLYTLKEKGGKPDRKPLPLPYRLRNPYRNLSLENSQDYAQKPQRNCTFMNLAAEGVEGDRVIRVYDKNACNEIRGLPFQVLRNFATENCNGRFFFFAKFRLSS
jgi:hypothetical protein